MTLAPAGLSAPLLLLLLLVLVLVLVLVLLLLLSACRIGQLLCWCYNCWSCCQQHIYKLADASPGSRIQELAFTDH
jgi:hypothetical protein